MTKIMLCTLFIMMTGLSENCFSQISGKDQEKSADPGSIDNYLRFDGENDVVNCGNITNFSGQSQLTIEMWVNIDKFSKWKTFFAKRVGDYNRIQFQEFNTPGDLGIAVSNNKVLGYFYTDSKPVTIGDWFHLAMVFDGNQVVSKNRLQLFINGVSVPLKAFKGDSVPTQTPANNAPVLLGAETAEGNYGYQGFIDEVRIWTVAKSKEDIVKYMSRKLDGNEQGLVVYYQFNQGKGGQDNSSIQTIDDKATGKYPGSLKYFAMQGTNSNLVTRTYSPPSVSASNVEYVDNRNNSVLVNWKSGSGTYRAVFMKKDSIGSFAPVDEITYSPDSLFGKGTQIGETGWYCIYNGTGNTVSVSGVEKETSYRIHVIEYNGYSGKEVYSLVQTQAQSENNPITIKLQKLSEDTAVAIVTPSSEPVKPVTEVIQNVQPEKPAVDTADAISADVSKTTTQIQTVKTSTTQAPKVKNKRKMGLLIGGGLLAAGAGLLIITLVNSDDPGSNVTDDIGLTEDRPPNDPVNGLQY